MAVQYRIHCALIPENRTERNSSSRNTAFLRREDGSWLVMIPHQLPHAGRCCCNCKHVSNFCRMKNSRHKCICRSSITAAYMRTAACDLHQLLHTQVKVQPLSLCRQRRQALAEETAGCSPDSKAMFAFFTDQYMQMPAISHASGRDRRRYSGFAGGMIAITYTFHLPLTKTAFITTRLCWRF